MAKTITNEAIAARLRSQDPEDRINMVRAMGVSSMMVSDWAMRPDSDSLTPEHIEQVLGWLRGEFGVMSGDDGKLHLIKRKPAPMVMLGVKAPPPKQDTQKQYGDILKQPAVPTGMRIVREALRGKDIPTQAKMSEQKRNQSTLDRLRSMGKPTAATAAKPTKK